MNILNLMNRKKVVVILTILFVIVILIIGDYESKDEINTVTPPTMQTTVVYKDLTVGNSTKEEAYQKLGSPVEENDVDGVRVIQFKSNNPNYNHELSFASDKLSFVKEVISPSDDISISDIEKDHGKYTDVLYGSTSGLGFDLYIYSEEGIAYIGNQYIGDVLEIWYFPPTNIQDFKELYAKEYFETRQPVQ